MSDPNDWFHEPDVKEGYAGDIYPVRWKAYKKGAQTKKKGRWQRMNEYGGWDNCDRPDEVFEGFEKANEVGALRARAEKAEAERDAAQAQVSMARNALRKWLYWSEQKCPCYEEHPDPCTLCGASVENLEPCKAVDATVPATILAATNAAMKTSAQAAADHDRRVRVEALENAKHECEILAKAAAHEVGGAGLLAEGKIRAANQIHKRICQLIEDATAIRAFADREERCLVRSSPTENAICQCFDPKDAKWIAQRLNLASKLEQLAYDFATGKTDGEAIRAFVREKLND